MVEEVSRFGGPDLLRKMKRALPALAQINSLVASEMDPANGYREQDSYGVSAKMIAVCELPSAM